MRDGRWKLYLKGSQVERTKQVRTENVLYEIGIDPGEKNNVAAEHPEVVQRLERAAERAREDLGDGARVGKGQRPAGMATEVTPRVLAK